MNFMDEFYPALSNEEKKEYDELFDKKIHPNQKDETLRLKKFLFGKMHSEAFLKLEEPQ